MAKNIEHIQHIKSNVVLENEGIKTPKLPNPSALTEGEIAVNYAEGYETISIKNSSENIVTFSSDNYYTEKKLGSGFTGENSGVTVTEALENVEITVDQVIDSGTSASTNAVATKAVYDAITDNELVWSMAYTTLSGAVSSHTENTTIHVTQADKTAWNDKVDSTDIANFFDDVKYEDSGTSKVINFYHGNTIKATINADDFIIDGMVDDVRVETVAGSGTCLVIDFNTASGKQDINIPISDLFDASNYYTKQEVDNKLGTGFSVSSVTDVIESNERVTATALNNLETNKLDVSAYTPTDLSNYYQKSETSGASEISAAFNELNTKVGSGFSSSSITEVIKENELVTSEALNDLDGRIGSGFSVSLTEVIKENELVTSEALNDLNERKLDVSAYTPTDLSNYYTKSETSGATQISNALSAKANTATTLAGYGITNAYTKSETSGATQISNALGAKVNSAAYNAHTANTTIHVTQEDRDRWDNGSGGASYTAGRGINITNDTISFSLPISAGTGTNSIIEGSGTKASGSYSHAEGYRTTANGGYSHAEGERTTASGTYSHAEGYGTLASGDYSHAEGGAQANGKYSHAEGNNTKAIGNYGSHAEGSGTTANGNSSHAEGHGTAASDYSHAEGYSTIASGSCSHAEGCYTSAMTSYSHAEGYYTKASGDYSHAEGYHTTASGRDSHAEGYYTVANNQSEHASGQYNVSSSASTTFGNAGNTLFSVGNGTSTSARHNAFEIRQNGDIYISSGSTNIKLQDHLGSGGGGFIEVTNSTDNTKVGLVSKLSQYYDTNIGKGAVIEGVGYVYIGTTYNIVASGNYSHAEGSGTTASGIASHAEGNKTSAMTNYSHAEGSSTKASGYYSHAEGMSTKASGHCSHAEGNNTTALGENSHAEGGASTASGDSSHAEGWGQAYGTYSHAEGDRTIAKGHSSHAEGFITTASGSYSHAEGYYATASGAYSHAEGSNTTANGNRSHAEGYNTIAKGASSHAEGDGTSAMTNCSHAEGSGTTANNQSEHASGQYNVSSSASTTFGDSGNTLFSVGNGTSNSNRKNAFEIRQNGLSYMNGNVQVSGTVSQVSDERLKDIIEDKELLLEEIVNAPLVSYTFKGVENDSPHIGTIAQYWLDILPEVVCEYDSAEKNLSLDYSSLNVAIGISLAKIIKKQSTEIDSLKEEIMLLKQNIGKIE